MNVILILFLFCATKFSLANYCLPCNCYWWEDDLIVNCDKIKINETTTIIPQGIITNGWTINYLNFANQNLTKLEENHFKTNLSELERLNIENCDINEIDKNIFSDMVKLNYLYMNNNKIKELDPEIFQNNTLLYWLELQNNELQNLEQELFVNQEELTYIHLGHNNLSTLPDGVFTFNKKLQTIHLNQNPLYEITDSLFEGAESVTELYLEHCKIQKIHSDAFKDLTNLQSLYLNDNKIRSFDETCFLFNINIHTIDLSNNKLYYLDSQLLVNLINLEYIDLSNNRLERIPENIFENNTELKTLKLHNNYLFTLNSEIFQNIHLTTLTLNENPWKCDCTLTSLQEYYKNITNLDDTKIPKCKLPFSLRNKNWDKLNTKQICQIVPNVQIVKFPSSFFIGTNAVLRCISNINNVEWRYKDKTLNDTKKHILKQEEGSERLTPWEQLTLFHRRRPLNKAGYFFMQDRELEMDSYVMYLTIRGFSNNDTGFYR